MRIEPVQSAPLAGRSVLERRPFRFRLVLSLPESSP